MMKKEWYAHFIIQFALPLCLLCVGLFVPLLINLTQPVQNPKETRTIPERIVALAPNLTEILFAVGLGEKIIAVSNDSDYPPEATVKQKVGTFWQPNIEAILAAKPDLVVTLSIEQHKTVTDTLQKLGYQVLNLKIETIDQLLTSIHEIGAVTGCQKQAEKLINDITKQISNFKSRFASVNKVEVLWVVQVEPLRVAGPNTFINELIELAGGKNAIGPSIGQYPSIGTEEILACAAETIIQSSMGTGSMAKEQQAAQVYWSRWSNLQAVKNNRIYVVDPDTILRLGPRLPQGIELIGRYLHPNMFTQIRDVTQ